MTKHLIMPLLVVLLCSFVYAQESENVPSDEDYKSESFYKNSDPTTWDWSKVDFAIVAVYQNPKLYLSPAFSQNFYRVPAAWYGLVKFYQLDFNQLTYSSLSDQFYQHPAFLFHLKRVPGSKYGEVKWDKVDFTKIHFKDVDWNVQLPSSFHQSLAKNQNALNNYCREQSGQACSIQVETTDIAGVIFTGKGMKTQQYNVELKHYPAGTLFEVVGGKIIAHLPQNQDVRSQMFASDTVRFIAVQQIRFIIQGEKDVKIVQGELEYKKGEWSIPAGKSAVINNVEVTASQEIKVHGLGGIDDIYFRKIEADIKNPETFKTVYAEVRENSVYLGERNILAFGARCEDCSVTAETVTLTFKQNNPYITIKPGGDPPYQQAYSDKLSITPIHGGAIWNNAAGEMTVAGRVRMQNGVHDIVFDNGGVYAKAVLEDKKVIFDSVPMKVRFFDDTMNNPYRDSNSQQLKDKQGKPIDNIIDIHEDNYIEFGNVEYFALSVDPHHLLKDTKNGFKLVNNIARFIKPLIIVETPVKEKWEQAYFDAAAQILADNVQGIPIIVRLENPKTEKEKQAFLESHSNLFKAIDEEAQRSRRATPDQPSSEQVVIGHNWMEESGFAQVSVIKSKNQPFTCWDKLIGCVQADKKMSEIYQDIYKNSGRLKKGEKLVGEEVVDGDIYFYLDGSGRFEIDFEGRRKIHDLIFKRLNQPGIKLLYGKLEYNTQRDYKVDLFQMKPERAPIFSAMRAVQLINPELGEKSVEDILTSPEMMALRFPSCDYAKQASEIARLVSKKEVKYMATQCH